MCSDILLSSNFAVFPELPWDETHLKPRSKQEEDDISTVGFANLPSKPPQICNDWVPDKFFTNFTAARCFSNSPMLQVHHDNNKDSSPPVEQDHSSLGQLFVSNSDLASCNPSEQQWVSMKRSPENNNADVLLGDLDTDSSSTITESCSSPDSEENLKFKPLNAGWSEDPVTPIFAKTFLDKSSKVTSLMHLDEADKVKLQDASTEECGQPSPVSILESPFLDEIQTTSEESVSGKLEKKQFHSVLKLLYRTRLDCVVLWLSTLESYKTLLVVLCCFSRI
jgi:hypothetical protein